MPRFKIPIPTVVPPILSQLSPLRRYLRHTGFSMGSIFRNPGGGGIFAPCAHAGALGTHERILPGCKHIYTPQYAEVLLVIFPCSVPSTPHKRPPKDTHTHIHTSMCTLPRALISKPNETKNQTKNQHKTQETHSHTHTLGTPCPRKRSARPSPRTPSRKKTPLPSSRRPPRRPAQ